MARRPRGRPRHPDVLTPTEWSVLDAVRHGFSRRVIAERRRISEDAVRYHVRNIAGKLGVAGMADLRRWAGYPRASAIARRRTMSSTPLSLGRIGQVSLFARDVARAEAFYRDTLGLPHLYTFGDLTFFDAGGTRLYIHAVGDDEWRPSSTVYFRVPDVDAAWRRLVALDVRTTGAPHLIHRHDDGTEEWMAFFEDPEGNTLALMSEVAGGAVAESAP